MSAPISQTMRYALGSLRELGEKYPNKNMPVIHKNNPRRSGADLDPVWMLQVLEDGEWKTVDFYEGCV